MFNRLMLQQPVMFIALIVRKSFQAIISFARIVATLTRLVQDAEQTMIQQQKNVLAAEKT